MHVATLRAKYAALVPVLTERSFVGGLDDGAGMGRDGSTRDRLRRHCCGGASHRDR